MPKGLFRGFGYVAIEATQQGPALGSDPIGAATTIGGIGTAHNESCARQTRHQAREIGIARDHPCPDLGAGQDRKSTRLNSSHLGISYAVFCLKKKKVIVHPGKGLKQVGKDSSNGKI